MGMLTRGSSKGQPRPGTGGGRSSGAARKMAMAAPTGCGGGERPDAYSESPILWAEMGHSACRCVAF
jgi:hypothetical protein